MALPAQIAVTFDFSNGATFGYQGFVIGDPKYGILGTSTLGSSMLPEPTVDLTPERLSDKHYSWAQYPARPIRGRAMHSPSLRPSFLLQPTEHFIALLRLPIAIA